jgi:uncharacterized UBP type Zn finger protein
MDCTHFETMTLDTAPSGDGCVECLAAGGHWVHLRRCLACGHIGCCDSSPGRHASAHARTTGHPLVQSYEPGEEWIWCFVDEVGVEIEGAAPSPSHP